MRIVLEMESGDGIDILNSEKDGVSETLVAEEFLKLTKKIITLSECMEVVRAFRVAGISLVNKIGSVFISFGE